MLAALYCPGGCTRPSLQRVREVSLREIVLALQLHQITAGVHSRQPERTGFFTFTRCRLCLNILVLRPVFMDDKQYLNEISFWCFAKDTGDTFVCLPPSPCRKEACGRYTTEYPYCVMMSRAGRNGREYP